jgi:hypothetical protein
MWRLSNAQALIFVAAVAIAVALLLARAIAKNLYASRTSLPLRRDSHTKVYCGDQKRLCDRTHV